MTDWLTDWMTVWLTDWRTGSLTDRYSFHSLPQLNESNYLSTDSKSVEWLTYLESPPGSSLIVESPEDGERQVEHQHVEDTLHILHQIMVVPWWIENTREQSSHPVRFMVAWAYSEIKFFFFFKSYWYGIVSYILSDQEVATHFI